MRIGANQHRRYRNHGPLAKKTSVPTGGLSLSRLVRAAHAICRDLGIPADQWGQNMTALVLDSAADHGVPLLTAAHAREAITDEFSGATC